MLVGTVKMIIIDIAMDMNRNSVW